MANDVTLPGNGAIVATEDVGSGREVQIVKLMASQTGTELLTKAQNSAYSSGHNGLLPLAVRRNQPTATATADGNYAAPIVDAYGRLYVNVDRLSDGDVLDTFVTTNRINQIELTFNTGTLSNFITTSTSGGGTASITGGQAVFTTSTAATASASGVTNTNVIYRPGNEVYAAFTAAFTTPTSASSFQRIGIYDANNGFFIGYEGTTFKATVRNGASDSGTALASFNGDPLDGSASSRFTRAGTPEAVDFTKNNIFRIRFAWFGSAPILFEIFTPDSEWLIFHTIRQPNTSASPSIAIHNLPVTAAVSKTTSDATNLSLSTACWAAGTTSGPANLTTSGSITGNGQSVSVNVPPNAATVGIQLTGTWTGVITFQGSSDGINFVTVQSTYGYSTTTNTNTNGVYSVIAAGFQIIRATSTSWTSGTANVTLVASTGVGPVMLASSLPAGTNLVGGVNVVDSAGTNKLAVSAGGAASVADANLELAQGSTTSGQVGPLVQGAVTTSTPSYTNGQTSPLSLTPSGYLRVSALQNSTWTVQPGNTANTTPWLATVNQGGNSATVSTAGALSVGLIGVVDSNNSTTTPLTGSATFTGTGTDLLGYNSIIVEVFVDQSSASSGFNVDFSNDNSHWDFTPYQFTLSANLGGQWIFPVAARYYRIRYTNGSIAQTAFRMQSVLSSASASGFVKYEDMPAQNYDAGVPSLTVRTDSTTSPGASTSANGDYQHLSTDQDGNLWVRASLTRYNTDANVVPATGTITTSSSSILAGWAGQTVYVVMISGTYAGVTVVFEQTLDASTFVPVLAQRAGTFITETSSVLSSNQTQVWTIKVPSNSNGIKVRSTAYSSGTANVAVYSSAEPTTSLISAGSASATNTVSSVSSSATNVTLLSANTARKGATIANDSTQILYLKLGATASTSSYTAKLRPDDYYEVPYGYTGQIDGIWASANGNARISELT